MTFPTFGDPVDPAYTKFKEDLAKAVVDAADVWHWRWNPAERSWFTYKLSDWIMEDLRLPDTPPRDAVRAKTLWPKATYEVGSDWALHTLWSDLNGAYEKATKAWPNRNLVWTPWGDGDWRSAVRRVPPIPPPGDGHDHSQVSKRAKAQIAQIEEWHRQGLINGDKAQELINDVLRSDLPDA